MECEVVMAYHLSCGPNPLGFPKAFNSPAFTEEGVTSIEGGFAPSTDYNCSVFAFGAFGNGPSVSTAFTTMDDSKYLSSYGDNIIVLVLFSLPFCSNTISITDHWHS